MSLAVKIDDHGFNRNTEIGACARQYSTINSVVFPESGLRAIEFKPTAPYSFSKHMLDELLHCARQPQSVFGASFQSRALISRRKNVFALGGDLAFFRDCILNGCQEALLAYARSAVSLIWESINASGQETMLSVAIVQGEAQGGGFEAALASHLLIAERGTWFGFPEGLFGLFPGMGAYKLLSARGAGKIAGTLIGSARRYSAEELFSLGIVDFLAEPGRGIEEFNALVKRKSTEELSDFRGRFSDIDERGLYSDVAEWVDVGMKLTGKHLRTIDYLIKAQQRSQQKSPTVRSI